jgi:hypothetical protein
MKAGDLVKDKYPDHPRGGFPDCIGIVVKVWTDPERSSSGCTVMWPTQFWDCPQRSVVVISEGR